MAGPCVRKIYRQQMHSGQSRFSQLVQQEAEDQVSDKKRADGDDAGENTSLHTAQRAGRMCLHSTVLVSCPHFVSWSRVLVLSIRWPAFAAELPWGRGKLAFQTDAG